MTTPPTEPLVGGYFIGTLLLEDVDPERGEWFEVVAPFGFRDPRGLDWWCRPGQRVNGASIPRIFWRLVGAPMTGKYRRAACLHDCAYELAERPRWECDRMFLEAMEASGVWTVKRTVMYGAVRAFGGTSYPSKR